MNDDILISAIAPVSDADAAALVSAQAAAELAEQITRTEEGKRRVLAPRRPATRSATRPKPGRLVRPAAATAAAAAAAAAAVIAVAVALAATAESGGPHRSGTGPSPAAGGLAAPTGPLALAANATVIASRSIDPRSTQWIYLKVLSTTSNAAPGGIMAQVPGTRRITETWTQVSGQKFAYVQHGKIIVIGTSIAGSPYGWSRITYRYLNSLPTSPAGLMKVIRHNIQMLPAPGAGATGQQIFDSVVALIENNPVLPARLSAACYGVLARLKSVRLGHVMSLAGKEVLSLYQVQDGYLRREILISPDSYAYSGQITVAVRSRTLRGLDGVLHVRKGELLADDAIIASQIVNRPGER
jgi:hypothetical protein